MPSAIYLDHNATTPIDPRVAAAMAECALQYPGNPASQHSTGRAARRKLEEARETVARILGCRTAGMATDRVVFTSGGTEANNLALRGLSHRAGQGPGQVIISAIEHPSISATAAAMQREGWQVDVLPVDGSGRVIVDAMPPLLTPATRLVSVMLGNNETGVLQPVSELARACRSAGVPLHTDAVQCVGKIDVTFSQLDAEALTLTAHKFHGPPGIGALLLRHDVTLEPQLQGGFQQAGLRPGTEPVALAVGLATALELWHDEASTRAERMRSLRDRFEQQLLATIPEAAVIGHDTTRLPHTSNIALVGFDRQQLILALDMAGIACSTGSACASGSSEPSSVLLAMGLPHALVRGSLRFSLGATTTPAEIDQAASRILLCCNKLRSRK